MIQEWESLKQRLGWLERRSVATGLEKHQDKEVGDTTFKLALGHVTDAAQNQQT
jgi:hypothetical protein